MTLGRDLSDKKHSVVHNHGGSQLYIVYCVMHLQHDIVTKCMNAFLPVNRDSPGCSWIQRMGRNIGLYGRGTWTGVHAHN